MTKEQKSIIHALAQMPSAWDIVYREMEKYRLLFDGGWDYGIVELEYEVISGRIDSFVLPDTYWQDKLIEMTQETSMSFEEFSVDNDTRVALDRAGYDQLGFAHFKSMQNGEWEESHTIAR